MKRRPGNGIEGATGCPSWCRPFPGRHFISPVCTLQQYLIILLTALEWRCLDWSGALTAERGRSIGHHCTCHQRSKCLWSHTLGPRHAHLEINFGWMTIILQGGPSGRIVGLGWLWFWLFHPLPGFAWADGKLAELAEQLRKMVEHNTSKSTEPQLSDQMDHAVEITWDIDGLPAHVPGDFAKLFILLIGEQWTEPTRASKRPFSSTFILKDRGLSYEPKWSYDLAFKIFFRLYIYSKSRSKVLSHFGTHLSEQLQNYWFASLLDL